MSGHRGVGPSLKLQVGTRGSPGIATGQSGLLLSCGRNLRLHLQRQQGSSGSSKLQQGHWASSRVFLGRLISSMDVQCRSCLVAVSGGSSLVLAFYFSDFMVRFNTVFVGVRFSLVVVCNLLSTCHVGFISNSSRGAPLSVRCLVGSSGVEVEGYSRGAGLRPFWLECGWLHGEGPFYFWH